MAANFAATVLVARLLTRETLGNYGLASSLVAAGALMAPLGVQYAAVRLVATAMATSRPGLAAGTIANVLRYGLLGNAVLAGLLLFGGVAWIGSLWSAPALGRSASAIVAWLVLTSLQILLSEVFRGFQDLRLATLFGGVVSGAVSVILLTIAWVVRGSITLDQVILIGIAAMAGNAILALAALRHKLRALGPPERAPARDVLSVALPLWINGITAVILGQVDLWILGSYVPKGDVAIYFVAGRLVALVTVWLLVVNMIVPPFIAELYARGETKRLERVLRHTATLAGIPAFGVLWVFILLGGTILGLFYGEEYRAGATVLAILSVGQLANVVGGSASITLAMTGFQTVQMWITIVSSAVTVVAAWWAAQTGGILGVACAAMGGQLLIVLASWLATRRCTGMWTHVGPVRLAELRTLLAPTK